jgi:lambda family phage portal protein
MGWFNRNVIATLSPKWAFEREKFHRAMRAYYEAGTPERSHKRRDNASANSVNERAGGNLRAMARHLEENYDIASGVLDVLVNATVGTGIDPEPLVELKSGDPAEVVNAKLMRLWDDWVHACEVSGQLDYHSMCRLVARSEYRDGEAFGQRLLGRVPGLTHGTVLPYSLQAFECDYVPDNYIDLSAGIRQGIKIDRWGRPITYYAYRSHPGDRNAMLLATPADLVAIDAANVLHVKMVKRLQQLRGVSVFASSLNRIDDIKETDESERVAARVAAAMAGFIKKGIPDMYENPGAAVDGAKPPRVLEMAPGMIFDDLLPGEDIGSLVSNRPNNALIPFRDSQLRAFASGAMVSFSSASKNYNGTYSAQRQEMVEQFVTYRALSGNFVFRWCQPVWDGFIDATVLSGAVDLAGVDMETIYNASHTAPSMPWIDPLKEIEAYALAEDRNYEAKSSIIRKRGNSPYQVYREIQRDKAVRKSLDIVDAAPQPKGQPGQQPAEQQQTAAAVFTLKAKR